MSSPQRKIWLKAAVIGSLWATLEIVIGSFLHNIHMPFAGTTLGFLSLSLLIGFHQKWQDKGLILRAAIIAALMRSLSPSAIIIGPMVGILLEGIFLDGALRVFGKNKLAYFLGAFATLSSNLLQKVVSILIFYGFDIVVVLKNMYHYALKQLHFPSLKPITLLIVLLIFYGLIAAIATILGVYAGKRSLSQTNKSIAIDYSETTNLFVNNTHQKQSTLVLFTHFIAIIGGLFLISYTKYYISIPIVLAYVGIIRWRYPNSFRRIARPKFWFQLFILILFTTLFFNGFSSKDFFNSDGLIAGLLMSLRAILLIVAFTAISFELRNPIVKAVLFKRGFSQLYVSLGLAFSALPSLLEHIIKPKNLLQSPSKQIARLINYSDDLLHSFQNEVEEEHKIIIISGKPQEGKTSFLRKVISMLQKDNIDIDGIIAKGIDKNGERLGFELSHIKSGNTFQFATTEPTENYIQYGPYYFDPTVFEKVNILLKNAKTSCIILDEIGPLELQEKGWAPAIQQILAANLPMIWVVRKSLLERVLAHWKISQAQVFDIRKYSPEKVANAVRKQLE